MTKAVLKKGKICPIEPLPADWTEGTELHIEKAPRRKKASKGIDIDEWKKKVDAAAAKIDPEDFARMMRTINEHRAQAKEYAKRHMGHS
jgi:hypothetical protein